MDKKRADMMAFVAFAAGAVHGQLALGKSLDQAIWETTDWFLKFAEPPQPKSREEGTSS